MSQKEKIQIKKKWIFNEDNNSPQKWPGIRPEIAKLLQNRGIKSETEAKNFLIPEYESLADPFYLPDVKTAVQIIKKAVIEKEKIVVYGDYDVDGVAATALFCDFLGILGANFDWYIPSRQEEGYGLNSDAIKSISEGGAKLIITVDCGTTSFEQVELAKELGLKVVVTDHHAARNEQGKDILPPADAVVNPKRAESKLHEELAGVGVVFYLIRALQPEFVDSLPKGAEKWFLDLVALGTICDVVPLTGDNRILAYFGLKVLAKTKRIGLRELAGVANFDLGVVSSYHVGFLIGPRLNAAGRLESASAASKLLMTKDEKEAKELAVTLNELNLERQEITERITKEAKDIIDGLDDNRNIYLLKNENWPAGVVGIVASRLVESYGKPVLVMEESAEGLKGSARSVKGFSIVDALSKSSEFLEQYGGHAYAAGFKLKSEHFVLLENKLIEIAGKELKEDDLIPILKIDGKLNPNHIDKELIAQLDQLAPFGQGNPKPIFDLEKVNVCDMRLVGAQKNHLKIVVEKDGSTISGMIFNIDRELSFTVGDKIDLACYLEENTFRGNVSIEFIGADYFLNK